MTSLGQWGREGGTQSSHAWLRPWHGHHVASKLSVISLALGLCISWRTEFGFLFLFLSLLSHFSVCTSHPCPCHMSHYQFIFTSLYHRDHPKKWLDMVRFDSHNAHQGSDTPDKGHVWLKETCCNLTFSRHQTKEEVFKSFWIIHVLSMQEKCWSYSCNCFTQAELAPLKSFDILALYKFDYYYYYYYKV